MGVNYNTVSSGVPVLNGSNLPKFKLLEEDFRQVTMEKARAFRKAIAKIKIKGVSVDDFEN